MSVVIVLVFVAIIMAGIFLLAFIWSVKNGQYEDTYTPSVRILFDDPAVKEEEKIMEKEKAQAKSRSDQSQLAEKKERKSQ
ncbi:MAG: cbb3-type cytochrome oxidase assembly protein CcoS [Bacteroidota bacterium]|nr:cbb3-type cytochrome oxidase assembly protein CcoS [Bacteroidota bacterium]